MPKVLGLCIGAKHTVYAEYSNVMLFHEPTVEKGLMVVREIY